MLETARPPYLSPVGSPNPPRSPTAQPLAQLAEDQPAAQPEDQPSQPSCTQPAAHSHPGGAMDTFIRHGFRGDFAPDNPAASPVLSL